uniref:Serine aminopeptidase S33 domain-containing protein n=1 Tax=Setaria digitata TaxID=48799 RepID=A0A915Q6F6_9BILA
MVDTIEEISNLELQSATGTLTSDELLSNVGKLSKWHYCHRELRKKGLKKSSADLHSLDFSTNFEESGREGEKDTKRCLQSKNPFELHHADSEAIQKPSKKHRCGCCQFCMLILKCTGILCYVFCCPPVPEMITRKLAFHPLEKGKTYMVCGKDVNGNVIRTNNAKKASKLMYQKFEAQHLVEGPPVSLEGIETSIIKTKRGSYLPILGIKNNSFHESSNGSKDLIILFSQPNSSDLGCYFQPHGINLRNICDLLQARLYAYDYSGYGISTGIPSEKNIYADIEAAYKHIFETQGSRVRIVLLGYSIGTAPTVYMASKHPANLCGIVLVAPFASGLRLYRKSDQTCCMDRFLSYDRAPEVNVPVLICHGCMDNVIPISHSEVLVERFPRAVAPFFVEHANHLTIFSGSCLSMYRKTLLITVIKLTAVAMGQDWYPYETHDHLYDLFYNPNSYQGELGYSGGCANIIMAHAPCQQFLGRWNLYPLYQDYQPGNYYQLQNYNTIRPHITEISPYVPAPYSSGSINLGIVMDLLNRGISPGNAEVATASKSMLEPRLLGANILNDKDRFMIRGCFYDTSRNSCADNLNLCKGKCKDFSDGLIHDCRCIPEDLLRILGLTKLAK